MNDFIFLMCIVGMVVGFGRFLLSIVFMCHEYSIPPEVRIVRDYARGYTETVVLFPWTFWVAVTCAAWLISGAKI